MTDAILTRLLEQEPRPIALQDVHADKRLQARAERLIPSRHRAAKERESEDHIARLRLHLEASAKVELDPILLARIDDTLTIVDGHHRTAAYRSAKRQMIPARVADMALAEAVMASKLANCENRTTLAPHPEERREWCWQYLWRQTKGGTLKPKGLSSRKVAGLFGVDKDTVARMHHYIESIDPAQFGDAACDPGTRVPLWRYVRTHGAPWTPDAPPEDAEKAAKRVKQIWRLLDGDPHAIQVLTFRQLAAEAAHPDTRAALESVVEAMDGVEF